MNNFRKITHKERLTIENALADFGTMDLHGGSREERDGKIIYNLGFYHVHLNATSQDAERAGKMIKEALGADEIWLYGVRIA